MPDESRGKADSGGGLGFILAIGLIFFLSVGAGFGYGTFIGAPIKKNGEPSAGNARESPASADAAATKSHAAVDEKLSKGDLGNTEIVPLEPILVNAAGSSRVWLRLEASIVLVAPSDKDRAMLVGEISHDIGGYLRGTALGGLSGAAELEFLREDLSELVRLRSNGKVQRIVFKSLVIE